MRPLHQIIWKYCQIKYSEKPILQENWDNTKYTTTVKSHKKGKVKEITFELLNERNKSKIYKLNEWENKCLKSIKNMFIYKN